MTGRSEERLTLARLVEPRQRARLLHALESKHRLSRIDRIFSHGAPWDDRWIVRLSADQQQAGPLHAELRSRGAPTQCWIVGGQLDGEALTLSDALHRIVGGLSSSLVICIPGDLAYFEGEELGDRFVLDRRPA